MAESPEPSIREALEASFESHQPEPEAPAPVAEPSTTAAPDAEPLVPEAEKPAPPPSSGKPRDDKGRFLPSPKQQEEIATDAAAAIGQPPAASVTEPPPPESQPQPSASKAPQSWKAAERELWAKLPPEAQAVVTRREREAQVAIQKHAEAAKGAEVYQQAIAPYEHVFRAEGYSTPQVVAGLAKTAYVLRTGTVQQKATIISNMMRAHGLNTKEGIEQLAGFLDGAVSSSDAPQQLDPQTIIQQAKVEFFRELQQARTQRVTQSVQSELEAFGADPKNEFFEDVREGMAHRVEVALKQGIALPLQDAYDRECWADPKIRGIFQQREASKQAANAQASTQRARAAASSVKPEPAGSIPSTGTDIRSALESAARKHGAL